MADQGSIALLSEHLLGLLRQNQEHPGAFEPAATGGKAGPLGMGGEYAGPLDNGSGLWGSSLWSNGPGANIWAANAAGASPGSAPPSNRSSVESLAEQQSLASVSHRSTSADFAPGQAEHLAQALQHLVQASGNGLYPQQQQQPIAGLSQGYGQLSAPQLLQPDFGGRLDTSVFGHQHAPPPRGSLQQHGLFPGPASSAPPAQGGYGHLNASTTQALLASGLAPQDLLAQHLRQMPPPLPPQRLPGYGSQPQLHGMLPPHGARPTANGLHNGLLQQGLDHLPSHLSSQQLLPGQLQHLNGARPFLKGDLANNLLPLQQANLRQPQLPPFRLQPPPPPPRNGLQLQKASLLNWQLNGQLNGQPAAPPRSYPVATFPQRPNQQPMHHAPRDRLYQAGAKPKADMAKLNEALLKLVDKLRPTPEEIQRQQAAFELVKALLVARWPHGKVHLFGSTANNLSICNTNDIDVCLELPDLRDDQEQAGKAEVVEQIGESLLAAGMTDVLPLPKARIPVVKFIIGKTATKVDVTVNNILALVNTKLLGDYSAIDERLLQLTYIVKHWAKCRQVNDSYRGTLSSYCYVLMCIHQLQLRRPAVLPCLHALQPATHSRVVGQWRCEYHDCVENLAGFGNANKESLAELVWAFFEHWAWKHDYNNAVVSVRMGTMLTKGQKEWTRRVGNERHLVCIEDPFELTHDLGRTVDRQTSGVLHKEFERAACILRDLAEPLEALMDPYRVGKSE